jgi:type II secretory pathway component PulM
MIRTYWDNLAKREQIMLIATGVVLIIFLFYLLVYANINALISQKQQELSEKAKFSLWLKNQTPKNNTQSKVIKSQELLSTFDIEIKQSPIKNIAYDLQQMQNGDLRLSCEAMPFNPFIKWLWSFNEKYQINLKNISIQSTNTTGVVNITVILGAV